MASAKPAWWLTVDSQSYGPYDLRTMQGYIAEGRVTGDSIVCRVGDQAWTPARGDTLLFRGGAAPAPPYPGGSTAPAVTPGVAVPAPQQYEAGAAYAAGPAPSALGNGKKIALAVLGAALVGLFFAPWVDVTFFQASVRASGYDLIRFVQGLQSGSLPAIPGMPGLPAMPGMPPGQRMQVQLDMGWRAYQIYALYLVPLAGLATFATALAGLRIWRVAAIACGVVVWGIVAAGAVQAADAGIGWSQIQDSLRYISWGFYGTAVVATAAMILGFTRG